jgi:hypothetical protein
MGADGCAEFLLSMQWASQILTMIELKAGLSWEGGGMVLIGIGSSTAKLNIGEVGRVGGWDAT